jgi:hypothetical protein
MFMLLRVRLYHHLAQFATPSDPRKDIGRGNGTPECARLVYPAEKALRISHDHLWSSNSIPSEWTDLVSGMKLPLPVALVSWAMGFAFGTV